MLLINFAHYRYKYFQSIVLSTIILLIHHLISLYVMLDYELRPFHIMGTSMIALITHKLYILQPILSKYQVKQIIICDNVNIEALLNT